MSEDLIFNFSEDANSGFNIINLTGDELPKLIDPIFPKNGLVSLVGSSDTGKSTLLRQLALSIALGLPDFIGYSINSSSRNVIYVSTEDDPVSTSYSLKKQFEGLQKLNKIELSALNHLKFIFDFDGIIGSTSSLFSKLESDLARMKIDLIVLDAFTDVFSGDINSSTKVREFLNQFNTLAKKYNCLILFLHHTGKRTDKNSASKDNVLGSQAFEAKMRILLELKKYSGDDSKRTLTITKGNYLSSEIKKNSRILNFDETNLLFTSEAEILTSKLAVINKNTALKDDVKILIQKYYAEKLSVRKIEDKLNSSGHKISKSSIANYIKECKKPL